MPCFVPGCNSGSAKNKRKCPLFRPPADPDVLRQWERNIQRKDKALTRKDAVCALHFDKGLVMDRYYSEHAGNVLLDERKVPRLRRGAVPTIFEGREVSTTGADSSVPEGSANTVAQHQWDAKVPLCGSGPARDASNYSAEKDASLETMPCLSTNFDAQNGELDQHVTVKREEDSSDACPSWNTELPAEEKIAAPSVEPDFRIKVENEEYCLGVQSPKEVVHKEDQGHVLRQLADVESNGAGVGCPVEVKREEECPDEQCPLRVRTIVCVVSNFDTPPAPRIVPHALVEHLVCHPEVVKLPLNWNYHKVRAPQGNRVVYCTLAVASDGTTPVVSKFVNVTDSFKGEPFEAFVSNKSLNRALGDAAKPATIEDVERMVEALDRLPMCSGGPPRHKYPDVDPMRARVDALGVWRHAECEVYGTTLCRNCARLASTLRSHAARQRKRKHLAKLRISLESLPPGQRSKVELLRKRSRCLYRKLRRLTGGGKELWEDDAEDGDDDDGSGDSESGVEYPEALS